MFFTNSNLMFLIKCKQGLTYFACVLAFAAFAAGITWAAMTDDAIGNAGCGMYNVNVTELDDGQWQVSAYTYHCGVIIDTREGKIGNNGKRQASFAGGVALFYDGEPFPAVDLLNMKDKLQRDKRNLNLTTVDFAHSGDYDDYELDPGDSASWTGFALVQIVVDAPSEWWIGALTYIGYGTDRRPWQANIKTVSRYHIESDAPVSLSETLYYEENVWNNSHNRTGISVPWPW